MFGTLLCGAPARWTRSTGPPSARGTGAAGPPSPTRHARAEGLSLARGADAVRGAVLAGSQIKDEGGDRFIESNRGKLFRAPSPEAEELDDKEEVDKDELSGEDIDLNDLED